PRRERWNDNDLRSNAYPNGASAVNPICRSVIKMSELDSDITHGNSDLLHKPKLAIDGGPPAIKHTLPPMYPGGMRSDAEEENAVLEVLRSKRLFRHYGPYPGGSKVKKFEKAFAMYMGTNHAVAVSSGSASLVCGLAALGLGPGDEVIVPAYTWIA